MYSLIFLKCAYFNLNDNLIALVILYLHKYMNSDWLLFRYQIIISLCSSDFNAKPPFKILPPYYVLVLKE